MKECVLYEKLKNKKNTVRCSACSQRCVISDNKVGICGVRKNIKGKLYLLVYGKVIAAHVDPIEKKPLYHFLPGSQSYSIATARCNFRCLWCQNYDISQYKEFPRREIPGKETTPEKIVEDAIKTKCKSISYTYTEPAIFVEFAIDTAKLAKKKNLKNIFVTNGYITPECLDYITGYVDAMNIDLKSFSDDFYRKYCGATHGIKPVLDNIKLAHEKKIHIEITTLVIPGLNDSDEEFEKIAKFIASVDKNIPWHISRFFPMYKMLDKPITPFETLKKAEKIGKKYLNHVYIGNV